MKLKNGISLAKVSRILQKLKFVQKNGPSKNYDSKFLVFEQNKFVIVLQKTHGNTFLAEQNLRALRFQFEMRNYSNKVIKNFDTKKYRHSLRDTRY